MKCLSRAVYQCLYDHYLFMCVCKANSLAAGLIMFVHPSVHIKQLDSRRIFVKYHIYGLY